MARYRLLSEAAVNTGASHILTAHTLDDQAETVLMRLLRGSGPTGLSGMAHETRLGELTLTRPLLEIPKARLVATKARLAERPLALALRRAIPIAAFAAERLAAALAQRAIAPSRRRAPLVRAPARGAAPVVIPVVVGHGVLIAE